MQSSVKEVLMNINSAEIWLIVPRISTFDNVLFNDIFFSQKSIFNETLWPWVQRVMNCVSGVESSC